MNDKKEKRGKGKKITLIVFAVIFAVIFLSLSFVSFYNAVLHPFKGYDKNFLKNYEEQDIRYYKKEFSIFYNDCVNYTQYECYPTEFYYNQSRKSILWGITSVKFSYADEAYSYIVRLKDYDYENIKQQAINSFRYLKTQVGHDDNIQYYDYIELGDWHFQEIFLNTDEYITDEFYESIEVKDPSFWLAYNDVKKEVVFHLFAPNVSLDYYRDIDTLKKYFQVNLYLG